MSAVTKEVYDDAISSKNRRATSIAIYWLLSVCGLLLIIFSLFSKMNRMYEENLMDKVIYETALLRQELLMLIRSRPITIGQALDVTDVIMRQRDVPIYMLMGIISQESEFDPRAISHKGAVGIMQLMPATYEVYSVNPFLSNPRQIHDPVLNMEAGISCIKNLYIEYGDWKLVLRAYVGGKHNANNKNLDWYVNGVLKKSEKFIKFNRKGEMK